MSGEATVDLTGRALENLSLQDAQVRNANFVNLKVSDGMLAGADISGLIDGLRINGIEVAPLIWAEMVRRDPPLALTRSEQLGDLREAWAIVRRRWRDSIEQVRAMPPGTAETRVDGEWSCSETLRHLVFVVDGWISRTVIGEPAPYHRLGLPPSFLPDLSALGIEASATPDFAEVIATFDDRCDVVESVLADLGQDDLATVCTTNPARGYPPTTEHSIARCLMTVVGETFAHHRYVERDLAVLADG